MNPMHSILNKIDDIVFESILLSEQERGFISAYLQDISSHLRHFREDHAFPEIDLLELYEASGADRYEDLILFLLETCIQKDDHHFVSHICSYCYGNLPVDNRIRDVLMQGILDRTKSNRLRERFFWIYRQTFKDDAKRFFLKDLEVFIMDNEGNDEIIEDILNFMHWHFYRNADEAGPAVETARNYVLSKPDIVPKLLSSTRELLGLPHDE